MIRLKRGDITLKEVYTLSLAAYKGEVDNKSKRMKMDIRSGKIIGRNNMVYDRKEKRWVQTGREAKLEFLVRSVPTSYKKTDTVPVHVYPVTFLIKDVSKGVNSPFRWRTGSNKRPKFAPKGSSSEKKLKFINQNIRNGIQMQFLMDLEWTLKVYGLLYGPDRTTGAPKVRNTGHIPFLDKHALMVLEKVFPVIFSESGSFKLNQIFKNVKGVKDKE